MNKKSSYNKKMMSIVPEEEYSDLFNKMNISSLSNETSKFTNNNENSSISILAYLGYNHNSTFKALIHKLNKQLQIIDNQNSLDNEYVNRPPNVYYYIIIPNKSKQELIQLALNLNENRNNVYVEFNIIHEKTLVSVLNILSVVDKLPNQIIIANLDQFVDQENSRDLSLFKKNLNKTIGFIEYLSRKGKKQNDKFEIVFNWSLDFKNKIKNSFVLHLFVPKTNYDIVEDLEDVEEIK